MASLGRTDGIARADHDHDGGQLWPWRRPAMSNALANTKHDNGRESPHQRRMVAVCTADMEQNKGQ
jgi:hypothetical protein